MSSIPGVLLIAAAVLMMQVVIDTHPQWFETAAERADLRLLALCFILGVTSWTGLCRLLRGETLKLRELEYIQAAQAFGVADLRIIVRHILPNLMHIVIIALVMDFSSLVLAEAVLSYVGIGVDPTMISFGTMINNARMELAREPMAVSYTHLDVYKRQLLYLRRSADSLQLMTFLPVILWSDVLIWLLVLAAFLLAWLSVHNPLLRAAWQRVGRSRAGMASATVLIVFVAVGLLDSIHYRPRLENWEGHREAQGAAHAGQGEKPAAYAIEVLSLLDRLLTPCLLYTSRCV